MSDEHEEILHCPFCGIEELSRPYVTQVSTRNELYRVFCSSYNCGVTRGRLYKTKKEAVDYWNKRGKQ